MHYVLVGGAMFGILAGIYYWFPKMTGRLLSEGLGKLSFWTTVIGFNVAFLPQHSAGLSGMPRRIVEYSGASARPSSRATTWSRRSARSCSPPGS